MRNRSRSLSALVLAAALGGIAWTATADHKPRSSSPAPDLARLSAAVKIEPVPSRPGAFLCTLEVSDIASGEVLSAPQVMFAQGQKATTRSGIKTAGGPQEVLLEVEVNAEATAATYSLAVESGGQRISSQRATVTLR